MKKIIYIFILVFLYPNLGNCVFLDLSHQPNLDPFLDNRDDSFVTPNELSPELFLSTLENAKVGVYLTVGTERSFMGLAMAKNVSHLLVIDYNGYVIMYNQSTRALLIAADSPEEFRKFKFAKDYSTWIIAKEKLAQKGYAQMSKDLSEQHHKNYIYSTFDEHSGEISSEYQRLFNPKTAHLSFNYVDNPDSFHRLRHLAMSGHLQFLAGGLQSFSSKYIAALQKKRLRISVLDMSNILTNMYDSEIQSFFKTLRPILREDSLLVGTFPTKRRPWRFAYYAVDPFDQFIKTQADSEILSHSLAKIGHIVKIRATKYLYDRIDPKNQGEFNIPDFKDEGFNQINQSKLCQIFFL